MDDSQARRDDNAIATRKFISLYTRGLAIYLTFFVQFCASWFCVCFRSLVIQNYELGFNHRPVDCHDMPVSDRPFIARIHRSRNCFCDGRFINFAICLKFRSQNLTLYGRLKTCDNSSVVFNIDTVEISRSVINNVDICGRRCVLFVVCMTYGLNLIFFTSRFTILYSIYTSI